MYNSHCTTTSIHIITILTHITNRTKRLNTSDSNLSKFPLIDIPIHFRERMDGMVQEKNGKIKIYFVWVVSYWKVLELIFVYCQMWFQLKYRSELLSKKLILALNLNLTKSDKNIVLGWKNYTKSGFDFIARE